jgi:hypothetical protein
MYDRSCQGARCIAARRKRETRVKTCCAAIVAGLLLATPSGAASLFEQLSPTPAEYSYGQDYGIAQPTYYVDGPHTLGPTVGDVTGTIFRLAGTDGSYGLSLGCDASDFGGGGTAGHIVLLSRGSCSFGQKLHNAQDAGAIAVLLADYDPDTPTLDFTGRDDALTIFGFRLSSALGLALADQTLTRTTTVRLALGDNLQPSAPVAEPASWALMLGGFGMVGGALRSRRRTGIRFA